ncbi:MAG TPA: hypothetical protein VH063_16030 [Gaiellaceae bacterium]|jgi:hypothetical protein|nr:hypothetical protein [Gaiellaceae bacterium]
MRIAVLGRGNVGGGLAKRWLKQGHEVDEFGRDGGDVSAADVVVLAVPDDAIASAIAAAQGIAGKPLIDTTNAVGNRPEGFNSLAEYAKSLAGGPTTKAFSTVFALLYDRLDDIAERPSCAWAGDDGAREVTETLVRDAGYEPVYAGGLDAARALEDFLGLGIAVARARGPFFYRIYD